MGRCGYQPCCGWDIVSLHFICANEQTLTKYQVNSVKVSYGSAVLHVGACVYYTDSLNTR